MRVAWHGPAPAQHGVGYAATTLLSALDDAGVEIDCFLSVAEEAIPEQLRERRLRFICIPPKWDWGRWYSRNPVLAFITGQSVRALVQRRLAQAIAQSHARRPYDFLYQFSQIELFGIRSIRDRLPAIVLHPEVHIAGELTWHRNETALAQACESRLTQTLVRAMLTGRTIRQRHDVGLARFVIAPSEHFAMHIGRDYGIPQSRIAVVPNPVDLDRFTPPSGQDRDGPLELVFVSRMSVRKGVDMIVSLSRRLDDLAGQVQITAVGDGSLFSDYRPLLRGLNPAVARYIGALEPDALPDLYRRSAAVLQPSYYEPFALTVAEGLAAGRPVVTSNEVGASERVSSEVCRTFPAGDIDAFEIAVRELVAQLSAPGVRKRMAVAARTEAARLFAPDVVASQVVERLACLNVTEVVA